MLEASPVGLACCEDCFIWGFPEIRGTLFGVPIIRIIVYWGLYWGPLILGNHHLGMCTETLRVRHNHSQ